MADAYTQGTANTQPGYVPVTYNAPATGAATTAPTAQYQARINQQLDQLQQPVNSNSAVVRGQTDAFNLAADRGAAQNRDALAEAGYAGGNLNSGDYGQQQQKAREDLAVAKAQNTGNVMATAEAQRQQQLGTDLNLGQTGALQQQSTTNQNNQFGDQLGLNFAQLGQNQNQFAAGQKQQQGQFDVTSAQNQQAITNALRIAQMNNDLGYYNTNTNANVSTRGQDITAAGAF